MANAKQGRQHSLGFNDRLPLEVSGDMAAEPGEEAIEHLSGHTWRGAGAASYHCEDESGGQKAVHGLRSLSTRTTGAGIRG
jgi:hypothetical protein